MARRSFKGRLRRRRPRRAAFPHDARGTHNLLPKAGGETINGSSEPLTARTVRCQEGNLTPPRGSEPGGRESDDPDGLAQSHAIEERLNPREDGETVLRRIVGVRSGDGGEVGEAELERHR